MQRRRRYCRLVPVHVLDVGRCPTQLFGDCCWPSGVPKDDTVAAIRKLQVARPGFGPIR
jgi:hypothetical protein